MQPTLIKHHTQTVHIYTCSQETEHNILFNFTTEYCGGSRRTLCTGEFILKSQFGPLSKMLIFFPPTCSAFCPSRLFCCELLNFGDIGHGNVCILIFKMELGGARRSVCCSQSAKKTPKQNKRTKI